MMVWRRMALTYSFYPSRGNRGRRQRPGRNHTSRSGIFQHTFSWVQRASLMCCLTGKMSLQRVYHWRPDEPSQVTSGFFGFKFRRRCCELEPSFSPPPPSSSSDHHRSYSVSSPTHSEITCLNGACGGRRRRRRHNSLQPQRSRSLSIPQIAPGRFLVRTSVTPMLRRQPHYGSLESMEASIYLEDPDSTSTSRLSRTKSPSMPSLDWRSEFNSNNNTTCVNTPCHSRATTTKSVTFCLLDVDEVCSFFKLHLSDIIFQVIFLFFCTIW